MMSCRLVLFMMWIGVNCMGLPRNSVYMVKYLGLKEEKVPFKVDAQFSISYCRRYFKVETLAKRSWDIEKRVKACDVSFCLFIIFICIANYISL